MAENRDIQESIQDFFKKMSEESAVIIDRAETEMKNIVGYLVEKKKVSSDDGQKIFSELTSRVKEGKNEIEKCVEDGSQWLMSHLNIPSRLEVEFLSLRVDSLNRKIRSLRKRIEHN
jgi:polyhydroxyalkanoate synthesis regulator phasin